MAGTRNGWQLIGDMCETVPAMKDSVWHWWNACWVVHRQTSLWECWQFSIVCTRASWTGRLTRCTMINWSHILLLLNTYFGTLFYYYFCYYYIQFLFNWPTFLMLLQVMAVPKVNFWELLEQDFTGQGCPYCHPTNCVKALRGLDVFFGGLHLCTPQLDLE